MNAPMVVRSPSEQEKQSQAIQGIQEERKEDHPQ